MLDPRRIVLALLAAFLPAAAVSAQNPLTVRAERIGATALREQQANKLALRASGTPKPNAATPTPLAGRFTPRGTRAMTQQARNAINYWGGQQARQTLAQLPTRPSFVQQASATAPAPAAPAQRQKPFNNTGVQSAPTISPYLQLFRTGFEEEATNYHAFVRPQLERQRENLRLRRQQESLRTSQAQRATTASTPTSGLHSQRFGNTGAFYSGWQR